MVIRRSDQRRRRVVIDEIIHSSPVDTVAGRPTGRKSTSKVDHRAYTHEANRRSQLKTTDLLPKRFLSLALVVLWMLSSIGLLNVLAAAADRWRDMIGGEAVCACSLFGPASLSAWFSSLLLILACWTGLQIYALRRHRCDDYRGTYRLWFWFAALCLLASINCVADLGGLAATLTDVAIGTAFSQTSWLSAGLKLLVLTGLAVRVVFEVWLSRSAVASLIISWLAYVGAIGTQLPLVKRWIPVEYEFIHGNGILFGTAALLLAHLCYARYVYLQAQGLATARQAVGGKSTHRSGSARGSNKAVNKKRVVAAKTTCPVATDPAGSGQSAAQPGDAIRSAAQAASPRSVKASSSAGRSAAAASQLESSGKLSKSAKRRLRKQGRDRRAA